MAKLTKELESDITNKVCSALKDEFNKAGEFLAGSEFRLKPTSSEYPYMAEPVNDWADIIDQYAYDTTDQLLRKHDITEQTEELEDGEVSEDFHNATRISRNALTAFVFLNEKRVTIIEP